MQVKAVIFNWAGTLVDFGALAPALAMQRVFADAGVAVTDEDVRADMGLATFEHIRAVSLRDSVADAWEKAHGGAELTDTDLGRLHEAYRIVNRHMASERGKLIAGVAKTCRGLRDNGILIGTTSAYTNDVMEHVAAVARAQGFEADAMISADDVPESRPSPLAVYQAMVTLGVYPASSVIKVDDTVPGLMEGKAAGTWTVGISETGNGLGLDEAAFAALPAQERGDLATAAAKRLADAGADYVIGSVAELPSVVHDIDERLADGERPVLMEYGPEAA